NPVIGNEKAAAIAKRAYREGRPVFEIALEDSGLAADELRRLLDPAALTRGGIPGRTDGRWQRRITRRVRPRRDGTVGQTLAMTAGPAPGVGPVHAVAMGVVAHAWARIYGTLGVGWLATLQVADIEDIVAAAFRSSLLILIPTCPGGLLVVWLYGRWAGPLARPHPRRRHRVRRPHFIGGDDEPQQRTPHRTPVHPRAARHAVDPALPGQRGRCGHPAARRQRGRCRHRRQRRALRGLSAHGRARRRRLLADRRGGRRPGAGHQRQRPVGAAGNAGALSRTRGRR